MCVCICVLLYGFVKLTWNHSVTCVTVYPLDHQRSAHDPPWTIPNRQTDQHLMSSFFSSFNWDPLPFVICFCFLEPPFSMLFMFFTFLFFALFPLFLSTEDTDKQNCFQQKKTGTKNFFLFFFSSISSSFLLFLMLFTFLCCFFSYTFLFINFFFYALLILLTLFFCFFFKYIFCCLF